MPVTLEQARAAKATVVRRFEAIGEIVGVGITRVGGSYAVKVNLREAPSADVDVPTQVDGVPVRVDVVGTIRPR